MFFQLQGPNCKVYAFMDKSKGKKANEIDFAISTLKKNRDQTYGSSLIKTFTSYFFHNDNFIFSIKMQGKGEKKTAKCNREYRYICY